VLEATDAPAHSARRLPLERLDEADDGDAEQALDSELEDANDADVKARERVQRKTPSRLNELLRGRRYRRSEEEEEPGRLMPNKQADMAARPRGAHGIGFKSDEGHADHHARHRGQCAHSSR
jgi:hypothetical protein